MARRFYGIRFYGGNRTCTIGTPNNITGRMSIACEIYVFASKAKRAEWISREDLSAPCGCGGGERIPASLKTCRSYQLGIPVADFNEYVEFLTSELLI